MRIIGTGFGRTGTLSLKTALERLGFGPCHHMVDVFADPRQIRGWLAAATAPEVDWDRLLLGYESCVDGPTSVHWRRLAEHYPKAKVILTTRDPDRWVASMRRTLFAQRRRIESVPGRAAVLLSSLLGTDLAAFVRMVDTTLDARTFATAADREPERAIRLFHEHTARVVAAIPAGRLLVFDVADGWGPLCEFLEVPVPAEPFPRVNGASDFTRSGLGRPLPLLLRRTRDRAGHRTADRTREGSRR
ncbi:sulfotransferase family protein [Sphaerisporangium rufum]|uniref:Sulfotransferase family protein n=1 Tax=Sphaerisporangium rufum TaxID=1381558 RepID=A0A919R778_9ACTN|nr:sulfotransferase family protein [Sphaerisporangium rufum]GII79525.1 sulfotransferase family protein [Sphaerisporangium rufum]